MCCGASRAIGLRPTAPILLGEEDGGSPRYVEVLDGTLIPNVSTGAYRYVYGSSVQQAIDENKLRDASLATPRSGSTTLFRVTLSSGETHDFPAYSTARQYAVRTGGVLSVVTEEPDA